MDSSLNCQIEIVKYRFVRYIFRFVSSPASILFLSIVSSRCLQNMPSRQLQDMSSRGLQHRSSRRLQGKSLRRPQDISSRRLQDVLQDVFKRSSRHLFKTSSRRFQQVFKTSWKTKNSYSEDFLKTSSKP